MADVITTLKRAAPATVKVSGSGRTIEAIFGIRETLGELWQTQDNFITP